MAFEIDLDLYLQPLRPFRLTDSTRSFRRGVTASCLPELLIEAKSIMNLDSQTKIYLILEEDETVVATEDFFQKLEDHTVLIAITLTQALARGLWTESLKSSAYMYLSYYQLKSFICMVDPFSVPFVTKDLKITTLQMKLFISMYISQIIRVQDLFVSIQLL